MVHVLLCGKPVAPHQTASCGTRAVCRGQPCQRSAQLKSRLSGGTLGGIVKQHDRSWPRLLAFLAITTLAWSLALAAVLAGVTVAIAGGGPPQSPDDTQLDTTGPGQIFFGVITDSRCGPRHPDSKPTASECARTCVRGGSRYMIVKGDRTYELAGGRLHLDLFAGQRVTLTGVLDGDTIKVRSASPQGADGGRQR